MSSNSDDDHGRNRGNENLIDALLCDIMALSDGNIKKIREQIEEMEAVNYSNSC